SAGGGGRGRCWPRRLRVTRAERSSDGDDAQRGHEPATEPNYSVTDFDVHCPAGDRDCIGPPLAALSRTEPRSSPALPQIANRLTAKASRGALTMEPKRMCSRFKHALSS